MKPSSHGENNFVFLTIKIVMKSMNYKKKAPQKNLGGYRVYPFRAIDSESEMAKKIAESPFVKEKLERAKRSLKECPITDEIIQEWRQSGKKKR